MMRQLVCRLQCVDQGSTCKIRLLSGSRYVGFCRYVGMLAFVGMSADNPTARPPDQTLSGKIFLGQPVYSKYNKGIEVLYNGVYINTTDTRGINMAFKPALCGLHQDRCQVHNIHNTLKGFQDTVKFVVIVVVVVMNCHCW